MVSHYEQQAGKIKESEKNKEKWKSTEKILATVRIRQVERAQLQGKLEAKTNDEIL